MGISELRDVRSNTAAACHIPVPIHRFAREITVLMGVPRDATDQGNVFIFLPEIVLLPLRIASERARDFPPPLHVLVARFYRGAEGSREIDDRPPLPYDDATRITASAHLSARSSLDRASSA